MKTASYTTVQTATGGSGKYPMSTQTLDFIQSQILLLQQLSLIAGKKCVLKEPDGTSTGIVVIDGEILTMKAKPVLSDSTNYIVVEESKEDIIADGETYQEARTTRIAKYSVSSADECYAVSLFDNFATNSTLLAQLKQMPATVKTYLQEDLDSKLSILAQSSVSQTYLDSLKTPCLACLTDSVTLFDSTEYCVFVSLVGSQVRQLLTLPDGQQYARTYENSVWSDWTRVGDDCHIELKIVNGIPYIRHGYLPFGAKILLLRKKRRSAYRRTGGDTGSNVNYRGKRRSRQPKTQYVHFKGIELSQGTPNNWYAPTCVATESSLLYGDLVDKTIPTLCKPMIYEVVDNDGNTAYRIQGTRVLIGEGRGKGIQHKGYAEIAVQIARSETRSKEVGGEMARMRYNIWRKKLIANDSSISYEWERYFSIE